MKFILIQLITLVVVSSTLCAQTTKGSLSFGGGLSYRSHKLNTNEASKDHEFQLAPQAGYFIVDNLEIGIQLILSVGETGLIAEPTKTSSLSIGPYARYFKFTSNDRFAFTAKAGFSIGSGKFNPSSGNDVKTGTIGFYLSPGFTYFLTDKWGLDFQLQGIIFNSYDDNKDVDNDNYSYFTFGVNSFNPSLGFRYYISK
ncbi:MAG: outer membrane beta-barrel protein [Cytophagales bacterium]|nr:outer membrane beta-barrel protein [Cytophagales bacterium]